MSVIKPTLMRSAFLYVFIGFLPVAANFLLAPVYTKFLDPDQYALIGLSTLFQTFLTFFLSFSLDSAFSRIYFNYERKSRLKYAVLGTLILTVIVISALMLGILLLIGNSIFSFIFTNPEFKFSNFGYWVLITTFCNIIFLFFAVFYRNEENTKKFMQVSLLFFFIPVAGTLIGLIGFKGGAYGSIVGRAIGSLVLIAWLLIEFFVRHPSRFKTRYLKIALKFSLPLIPFQLMFAGFSNIDRFVLERYFSAYEFGVYNFAVMVTGVIPVFLNALGNATNPRIFRVLGSGGSTLQVKKINNLSLLLASLVICLCIAFVVPMMRIFINPKYNGSYIYIGTLFLSFIPYLHYLIYNIPLFFFSKTKVFPVIAFFALISGVVFNLVMIPVMGLWAVCFSLYVIRFVQALAAWYFVKKNGYHRTDYIRHKKPIVLSFIIILLYNTGIFINMKYDLVSVDIINVLPMLTLLLLSSVFYKEEVRSLGSRLRLLKPTAG